MTALPSFIELMASLGLEQKSTAVQQTPSEPSPSTSPAGSPPLRAIIPSSPIRSKSSPSLRDLSVSRNRVARYSPYSPALSYTRRGSMSSVSSSSSDDRSPTRHNFSSSSSSSLRARRSGNTLSISTYGSASDLPANMPISTYVRRKTPGASPTSPTFPRDSRDTSSPVPPMPLTVPTLPILLPNSANSDSFPITPGSDVELPRFHSASPNLPSLTLPESKPIGSYTSHFRRHTGVRISTPPRLAEFGEPFYRRRPIVDIA